MATLDERRRARWEAASHPSRKRPSRLQLEKEAQIVRLLQAAIGFWSALTAIDRRQFTKPYRAVADPSRRRAKHVLGCPAVVYNCAATHRLVMGMIDGVLSPGEILPG